MPIYEYRCQACRKRTSALLASWSSENPPCSSCGSTKVHRLVSTFATVRGGEEGGASDFDDFDDAGGG
ncbi:MAG TPA: zinc ribbon domain-containing protein, partial [Candidatus Dormibacteraeota bacterium]|nr:zinc ribbon domain-containing protein [Candidatus Dormibacteraeota bacterium]